MANLHDILYKVRLRSISGSTSIEITDVVIDSRQVSRGSCFIAIKGGLSDGHDYIYAAVEAGAIAIVCFKVIIFKPFIRPFLVMTVL